ncbi:type IV secretion system protein [Variovorax sp. VNK109]|uniref:type IV secretion system protein n=1 Tax=Variovorax sp. VNK109 TaxID=3400919 RepID=UPI003C117DAD
MEQTSFLFVDVASYVHTYFRTVLSEPLGYQIDELVRSALLVYVAFYGFTLLVRKEEFRFVEVIHRALQVTLILVVTSFLQFSLGDATDGVEQWMNGVTQLVSPSIVATPSQNDAFLKYLDDVVSHGNLLTKRLMDRGVPFTEDQGATWWGFLVLLGTVIPTAVAGGLILVSELAVRLLLFMGPLFALSLLFRATAGLFWAWASQILNAVLTCALLIAFTRIVFSYWIRACDFAADDIRLFNLVHVLGASCLALIFTAGAPLLAVRLANGIREIAQTAHVVVRRQLG